MSVQSASTEHTMYIDRPSPSPSVLVIPMLLALFFVGMGAIIATLAVLFLPATLWMFAMPPVALCVAAAVGAGWQLSALLRLEYRVGDGRLTIRCGRGLTVYPLSDLSEVIPMNRQRDTVAGTTDPAATDWSGAHSARGFANRSDTAVLLKIAGEWIRVSPAEPERFVRALRAGGAAA